MDNSNTCAFGEHVTSVFSDLFFFRLGRKTGHVWLEGHIKQSSVLLPFWSNNSHTRIIICITNEWHV